MSACLESLLEPANALCWLWWRWASGLQGNVKASDELAGFRSLRDRPSWAKWEFLVLFPPPNESSFRTLTCLLAKPQEGNDAALAPCLPGWSFIQTPQRKDIRKRPPVVLKNSDCTNQLRVSSGWIPTYLSRRDMPEPECSRFSVKLWCQGLRKEFTLLFLSPPVPSPSRSPRLVSVSVIWPLHPSQRWFGLFTLWIIISQISKLFYSQSYNTTYCIV